MGDMEATYILLNVLPTDNESWPTFGPIQENASRPKALMDEMINQESQMKSERMIAGARLQVRSYIHGLEVRLLVWAEGLSLEEKQKVRILHATIVGREGI